MPVPLPNELLDLLGRPSPCFVATIMPDGSPQLTQARLTGVLPAPFGPWIFWGLPAPPPYPRATAA